LVSPVHDRMPVIFTPDAGEAWLEEGGVGRLQPIEDDFLIKASEEESGLRLPGI